MDAERPFVTVKVSSVTCSEAGTNKCRMPKWQRKHVPRDVRLATSSPHSESQARMHGRDVDFFCIRLVHLEGAVID